MTIKTKLALTLLASSAVVSVALFVFLQWSFDRGFVEYVNQQQEEELTRLAGRLATLYEGHDDWSFLTMEPRTWERLLFASTGHRPPRRPPPSPNGRRAQLRPPPPGPMAPGPPPPRGGPPASPRLGPGAPIALYDARRRLLIGPPAPSPPRRMVPIVSGGRTVGYLATAADGPITDAGDLLFVERQTQLFALVSGLVLLLALLLSIPMATALLRPIRALAKGTESLACGHYETRVEVGTEDELGQLCHDFNRLAATLEKNEQARKDWVADIAHELRTPLAVLRAEIEALQDGVHEPDAANLATLHGEVLQLTRLVEDLYELSMSEVGALSYRLVPCDALGLLRESVEAQAARLEEAGLTLELELPEAPAVLPADPGRLRQLFENLLANSLRYTRAPGTVRISATVDDGSLTIDFDDSPPGASAEQRARLFDRLYRTETSRNRGTGGAGLGLAICRNVAEAHGGRIEAHASPLGGLRVRLALPLMERTTA